MLFQLSLARPSKTRTNSIRHPASSLLYHGRCQQRWYHGVAMMPLCQRREVKSLGTHLQKLDVIFARGVWCSKALIHHGGDVLRRCRGQWGLWLHSTTPALPLYMRMECADAAECLDQKSKYKNKHPYYYNDAITFKHLCS